jgi:hypothetical protein
MPKAYLVAHIRVHDREGTKSSRRWPDRRSPTMAAASSCATRRPITARGPARHGRRDRVRRHGGGAPLLRVGRVHGCPARARTRGRDRPAAGRGCRLSRRRAAPRRATLRARVAAVGRRLDSGLDSACGIRVDSGWTLASAGIHPAERSAPFVHWLVRRAPPGLRIRVASQKSALSLANLRASPPRIRSAPGRTREINELKIVSLWPSPRACPPAPLLIMPRT